MAPQASLCFGFYGNATLAGWSGQVICVWIKVCGSPPTSLHHVIPEGLDRPLYDSLISNVMLGGQNEDATLYARSQYRLRPERD